MILSDKIAVTITLLLGFVLFIFWFIMCKYYKLKELSKD